MKKIILLLVFTLFIGGLWANPINRINDWAKKQQGNLTSNDVVNFIKGNRVEGDITYGGEYIFNSATAQYISAEVLDPDHFVIAYEDIGNNYYGTAIIGTVSGLNITYGSEFVFNVDYTTHTSVTVLDSLHFIVAYTDHGNSDYGTAVLGTVSDSSIAYGNEYVFNTDSTDWNSSSALDSLHFIVAYTDHGNSDYGTAVFGTVSGSIITYGSEFVFNAHDINYISIATLDAMHFVVAYDNLETNYGTAIVGTVSGSNISYGSKYVYDTDTYHISITALSSSKFVVAYCDYDNSNYGTAIIGMVSGSNISFGSKYVYNSASTFYITVAALDTIHFVVAYSDYGNSTYGTALIGTVSDSSISYGSEYVYNSDGTRYFNSVTTLDATHFVVAYEDVGGSYYGTAVVGEIEGAIVVIPTNVIITVIGNDILLSWDDMGATTYNIYRSTNPYAEDWGYQIGSSSINSYTDEDAATGEKYFYYITSEN